jgi:hypothetical protein
VDFIAERVAAESAKRAANIEAVCVRALLGGQHGVLVETGEFTEVASVSPEVPFGEIHYRRVRPGIRGVSAHLMILDEA